MKREVTQNEVIKTMYSIHKKNLTSVHNDFLPSKNLLLIFETSKYYFKQWSESTQLRLWKKSGKVTLKTIK